jgi:SNF2 family DNA or RNA helicase
MEAFPNTPHIGRGTTMEEGVKIEKDWNAKKIPLLIGFTGSVSHGLNLQEAGNHVALYSLLYNADMYDQFIRRVQRQGNENKRVFVHRFIAKNTVDEAMVLSLNRKITNASKFLDALTLYREGIRE